MKVFLSARISELERERDIAIQALEAAGHVALRIDDEPHIRDFEARQLMIDRLRDAEALISIHYLSEGRRDETLLGNYTPLEFELATFVRFHPQGPILLFRKQVDELVTPSANMIRFFQNKAEVLNTKITLFRTAAELEQQISRRLRRPRKRTTRQSTQRVSSTPSASRRLLKVFICHASSDKESARLLHRKLTAYGVDAWLDEEKLVPGQEWQFEIPRAIRAADVVLVCLSPSAVSRTGYVQKEIRYALDVADEQPEGAIFIVPVKLSACEVPLRLAKWQWVDMANAEFETKLRKTLELQAIRLGTSPLADQ